MPRISKSKGSMIGGVRSPMAAPAHGLVKRSPLKPSTGAGAGHAGTGRTPPLNSPYNKGAIVKR